MGYRGGIAKATARMLRKQDKDIENKWKKPYTPFYDEQGIRSFSSPKEMYIQSSREHGNTTATENIHVQAYHMTEVMNLYHKEPKFDTRDDIRTFPIHGQYDKISWVLCKYHWCKVYLEAKKDNDCFPVTILGTPNNRPYLPEEMKGYLAYMWYKALGVVELQFNLANYWLEVRQEETLKDIKQNLKMINNWEIEFWELTQGKYKHLKKIRSDKDRLETTEELDCIQEEDGLYLASLFND